LSDPTFVWRLRRPSIAHLALLPSGGAYAYTAPPAALRNLGNLTQNLSPKIKTRNAVYIRIGYIFDLPAFVLLPMRNSKPAWPLK
jgi:hypothetical protein